MAKRVYTETVKKWLIGAGITVGTLIGGIFLYLIFLGAITITGYSGDMVCAGIPEDPCYAYINFTANEDIFIYPMNYDPWGRDTFMEFDPAVKSWKLQRSWGSGWRDIPLNKTCTGTWCGLSNKDDKRKFSIAFREGRNYQIRIVAYKNKMTDTIKWGAFDKIDPLWEGLKSKTEINKNSGIKKTSLGNFSISSPNSIRCIWGKDNKKHCETIIILENNYLQPYEFRQKKIDLLFERSAEKMKMEISTNYREVIKEVLDWDCIEIESSKNKDLTIEEARAIDELSRGEDYYQKICKEEITDYEFTNWQPLILSNLNQIPANSVIGIKLQFDTELWRGSKAKNNFNISLMGQEFDLVLDPEIDDCSVINSGGTYTLNQTIVMGSTPCIDINASNVFLDCNGYKIDGTSGGSAIYVRRASATNVNATILDCSVDDTAYALDFRNADNINVTNFYSFSAGTYAIYTYTSDSHDYKNITVDGANDADRSWYYYDSVGTNTITDLTIYDMSSQAFRSYDSLNINISNVISHDSSYGFIIRYPWSGSANIDIDNLTSYDNTYTGLQFDQTSDIDVSNSKIYNNSRNDIDLSPSTAGHCDGHSFTNVQVTEDDGTATGKLVYRDTASQTISNDPDINLLILCDSDNSVVNNVTVSGFSGKINNGILIYLSSGLNITGSILNYTFYGITGASGSANSYIAHNKFYNSENYDIYLSDDDGTEIYNNTFTMPITSGSANMDVHYNTFDTGTNVVISEASGSTGTVYNNIFNKSNGHPYVTSVASGTLNYNTTRQAGGRIVGDGTDIGGNVYYNSSGGYYSDCTDSNMDGICDDSYDMGSIATESIDYLALSDEYTADAVNPWWVIGSNSTNDTTADTNVLFSLNWRDDIVLDKYVFSWRNGGNWTLDNSSSDQESGTQSFTAEEGGGGAGGELYSDNFQDGVDWLETGDCAAYLNYGSSTPSSGTGPQSGDSSDDTTNFVYIETSSGNCDGSPSSWQLVFDQAIDWDAQSGENVTFYTNRYGNSDLGTMIVQENSTGSWVQLGSYSQTGDDGNGGTVWTKYGIDASSLTGTGYIRFSSTGHSSYTGDAAIDWFNITSEGGGDPDNEANKTAITYSDVLSGGYDEIRNITTIIYVSYYNNSGSEENGNNNATLWLEVYNGSDWLDEGDFSVNGDNQNFSITTTTASILTAWETDTNRDVRISARLMDYNSTTNESDVINWTGVWVSMFTEQEWFNESEVSFVIGDCTNDSKTDCWSNSSHTVTSTVGALIEWRYYVWDGVEKTNYSDVFSFVTTAGVEDTCTCPGSGNNWEVDMEDTCTLSTPCNLGTGNLSWIGSSGSFTCNAQLNLTNRNAPPSNTIFYYSSGCKVNRLIILLLLTSATVFKRKRRLNLIW